MAKKWLYLCGIWAGIVSSVPVSLASPVPNFPQSFQSQMQISLEFPPSPDRGKPNSTAGGGTRGNQQWSQQFCTEGDTQLMPLMPTRNNAGTTVDPNPTFFIFVPETTAKIGEFVLINDQNKDVYVSAVNLPSQPGIIQVSLPETVSLSVGEEYTWQFVLKCDIEKASADEYVSGSIQRTELEPNLQTQIEQTQDLLEQAKLYAKERIWQDTLMILAKLRDSNEAEWKQLLESVGLGDLASEPFAPCCQEAETPDQPQEQSQPNE